MTPEKRIVMGMAWYRPEDWEELLRISADAGKLESTHAEWLECAIKARQDFLAQGIFVHKVVVDLEDLKAWCARKGVAIDGDSRSEYACDRMEKTTRHAGPDHPKRP